MSLMSSKPYLLIPACLVVFTTACSQKPAEPVVSASASDLAGEGPYLHETGAAMDKMMKGIDPPAVAKCANPIDRNLALGEKIRIDGTPTIVFADGRVRAGMMSAEDLEHMLAGG